MARCSAYRRQIIKTTRYIDTVKLRTNQTQA